jgi:hypothetical protein
MHPGLPSIVYMLANRFLIFILYLSLNYDFKLTEVKTRSIYRGEINKTVLVLSKILAIESTIQVRRITVKLIICHFILFYFIL